MLLSLALAEHGQHARRREVTQRPPVHQPVSPHTRDRAPEDRVMTLLPFRPYDDKRPVRGAMMECRHTVAIPRLPRSPLWHLCVDLRLDDAGISLHAYSRCPSERELCEG